MPFRVGEQVVCVDDGHNPHLPSFVPMHTLKKGDLYVVRGLDYECLSFMFHGVPGVYIEGQYGDICPETGWERSFNPARFRSLLRKQQATDISVFQKILDKCNQSVKQPEKV